MSRIRLSELRSRGRVRLLKAILPGALFLLMAGCDGNWPLSDDEPGRGWLVGYACKVQMVGPWDNGGDYLSGELGDAPWFSSLDCSSFPNRITPGILRSCRVWYNDYANALTALWREQYPGEDWWNLPSGVSADGFRNSGGCPIQQANGNPFGQGWCQMRTVTEPLDDIVQDADIVAGQRCDLANPDDGAVAKTSDIVQPSVFDSNSTWYGHVNSAGSSITASISGTELAVAPVFGKVSISGSCEGSTCSLQLDGIELTVPDLEIETSLGSARFVNLRLRNSGPWYMLGFPSDESWAFDSSGDATAILDASVLFQSVEASASTFPKPAELSLSGEFVNSPTCLPSLGSSCSTPSPAYLTVGGQFYVQVPNTSDWISLDLSLEIPLDGGTEPQPRVATRWLSSSDLGPGETESGWQWDASFTDWGNTLNSSERGVSEPFYSWSTRKGLQLGNGATLMASAVPATDTDGGSPFPLSLFLCGNSGFCASYPIFFERTEDCDVDPVSCNAGCGDGQKVAGEECDDGNLEDGDGCSSYCLIEAVCGDGVVGNLEECDEGTLNGEIASSCTAECKQKPYYCPPAPVQPCMEANRAKLLALEHKGGKEGLKVSLLGVSEELTLPMFGEPSVSSERMNLCLYNDADELLRDYEIDRGGEMCGSRPCWSPKSTKGFMYKDRDGTTWGINKMLLFAGAAGKGKVLIQGKNNAKKGLSKLPFVAPNLSASSSPTVQLISESGLCIGAKMTSGGEAKPGLYKAKK